jgi:hypothetical protein
MAGPGRLTAVLMLMLGGWSLVRTQRIAYRFVDTLSAGTSPLGSFRETGTDLLEALDTASIERAAHRLASPKMEGRGRGTPGNALARAYIVSRLRQAGLAALFNGDFVQPTFPDAEREAPYAVNVGAYLPAAQNTDAWIVLVAHYDHLGMDHGTAYPGADDNAGAVAMLLALADALGRARPPFRRHVVLLFPDAEEPPNIRTDRMGSTWFWRHPPFPLAALHCALIFDLLAGPPTPVAERAGLTDVVFVLGAEASRGLARLARGVPPEPGLEPWLMGLPLVEACPFTPRRRFAQSDYHGLRENGGRPFLFVTSGRAPTYHTPEDTADTLDYDKLARLARWVARLAARAAAGPDELGWTDMVADPVADARTLLRLHARMGDVAAFPWLLRRSLRADRARIEERLRAWEAGAAPTAGEYREVTLMALRLQAAAWHPAGWWFGLW